MNNYQHIIHLRDNNHFDIQRIHFYIYGNFQYIRFRILINISYLCNGIY